MVKALGPSLVLGSVLCGGLALAQPGETCSHDVLRAGATAIDLALCVTPEAQHRGGGALVVAVAETFWANGGSFGRIVRLEFTEGSDVTRAMDDVPLRQLGMEKSLHLTMRYRAGTVRLEHALLLPDAIGLK